MQQTAAPEFAVLHALRLKGLADAATVSATLSVPEPDVERVLASLVGDDLVVRREGRLTGWSLTPAGRARHAEVVAAELADAGVRTRLEEAYRRFLPVNRDLLQVCTDWQVRDGAINDHSDAAYDGAVLDRLDAVDAAVHPLLAEMAAALPRFAAYGPRLTTARELVRAGQVDWFTTPVIDSYHTIWFELHEDLLSTLGIERSKEESS